MLDDLGLAVAEVDGSSAWLPGQPGPPFEHMVEVAADLGARSITLLEVTGEAPDPSLARDAFAAAAARAADAGVAVHLEPFAWSGVATLADALAVVGDAGGVLLDVCHHVLGPDAGAFPPGAVERIVAVQVADPGPARMQRSLPGPVTTGVLAALPPGLPLEVEVFGLGGDPFDAARACRAAMEDLLAG
jgi:sugar phosphate isomerase/epimerase